MGAGFQFKAHDPVTIPELSQPRSHASYVNNRLGFSFSVSPLWENYFFVERMTDRAFVVDVYIKVEDTSKLALFTESEQRHGGVLVESVLHMTEEELAAERTACEKVDDEGICYYPEAYAWKDGFVLATEMPQLHAGWDYCSEPLMKDEIVCRVRASDVIDGKSVIGRTLFFNAL